jgi:hypothetical protein
MKTRDAESVLVIEASGFVGYHLGCRLIGLCGNAMAQVWPLYPGSPLPTPSGLTVVDQLCREGGFNLAVNACPSFLPDNPVPRRLPLLHIRTHAPHLLRNEKNPVEPDGPIFRRQRQLRLQPCYAAACAKIRSHNRNSFCYARRLVPRGSRPERKDDCTRPYFERANSTQEVRP